MGFTGFIKELVKLVADSGGGTPPLVSKTIPLVKHTHKSHIKKRVV
jgi:hypothetical protein